MAERERDLGKALSNIEQETTSAPMPQARPSTIQDFTAQKYRQADDSLQQIQQDFRKIITELEQRYKAIMDQLKRITG